MSRRAILEHRPARLAAGIDEMWIVRWLYGDTEGNRHYKVAQFKSKAGAEVWCLDHDFDLTEPRN